MVDTLGWIFSAGFQIITKDIHIGLIASMFSILPFGLLAMLILYRLKITKNLIALISGGLCGGLLFDVLVSLLVIVLSPQKYIAALLIGTSLSVWILMIALWRIWQFSPRITTQFYVWIALMLVIFLCKMAFIYGLDLPQYSDSIEHYTIIQDLASKDTTPRSFYNLADFPQVYYHYGYHSLVAKLYLLSQANLGAIMLYYGQLILVISAFGLFFPTYLATHSQLAAWWAVISAAFVWVMPGYAVNWGKYPAITAYAAFPFVLGLIIAASKQNWQRMSFGYYSTLVAGVLACILIHTRMAVIITLLLAVANVFTKIKVKPRELSIASFAILIFFCILAFLQNNSFISLFEIYWRNGIAPLILALLACGFCAIQKPRLSMPVLLFVLLCILATTIPLPSGFENRETWVDRPFFQIGSFLPVSILTGAGFSALFEIPGLDKKLILQKGMLFIICAVLLISAPWDTLLHSSESCRLSKDEDLYAYHWIQSNIATADRFLISAVSTPFALFESDGGGWVENMTNHSTVKVASDFNFGSGSNKTDLCTQGIRYIYVGDNSYSFDDGMLSQYPYWYKLELDARSVKIYRVLC